VPGNKADAVPCERLQNLFFVGITTKNGKIKADRKLWTMPGLHDEGFRVGLIGYPFEKIIAKSKGGIRSGLSLLPHILTGPLQPNCCVQLFLNDGFIGKNPIVSIPDFPGLFIHDFSLNEIFSANYALRESLEESEFPRRQPCMEG
jgi:hypothetical protein